MPTDTWKHALNEFARIYEHKPSKGELGNSLIFLTILSSTICQECGRVINFEYRPCSSIKCPATIHRDCLQDGQEEWTCYWCSRSVN